MKKVLVSFIVLAALFSAVSVISGCQSPPPPAVEEPQPEPPPPPPPPPEPPAPPEPPPAPPEPEPVIPLGLDVTLSPQPFSPDGDGVDDELTIEIAVTGTLPVVEWSVVISEPVAPFLPFYELRGEGEIPPVITWDGIGDSGDLVHSAIDYPITITLLNEDGESAVYENVVRIDVLVRDEGGVLRVIVPSIIFNAYTSDFSGLEPDVVENNLRVLGRIAEILESFGDYQILVEGHANPTAAPGTRQRAQDEAGTARRIGLLPLSQARAATVLEHLVELGVARERLSSVGLGTTRTIVEFEDRDYWWQNRRVEFILQK